MAVGAGDCGPSGRQDGEESELEYLTEIRTVRDKQPELFARIKRLPKKARSTRTVPAAQDAIVQAFPSLLTLPKPTTKKVAEALKHEVEPLKVLGILRREISTLFFLSTRAQQMSHSMVPREVILSSWISEG